MQFNNDKLKVNFLPPTTPIYPIEGRKYTFTHSDTTGMLFLDIGNTYNYDVINIQLRDEVLGEWIIYNKNSYTLCLYIYLKGIYHNEIQKKYQIFKSHLELAITSILYGDIELLKEYPYLMDAPIHVKFSSNHFMFNSSEYYETPSYYLSNLNN